MLHGGGSDQSPLRYIHQAFLFCATVVAIFQIINNVREVDFFAATHWVWDYSLGFIKRGLVGQATEYLFGRSANTYDFISKSSIILLVMAISSYILFSYKTVTYRPGLLAFAVGMSGLLLYPVVPSLIYDNGRFDHLNYVLLLAACWIAMRSSLIAGILAYEACCCLSILVHEGFFLQQFPVLTLIFLSTARIKHGLTWRQVIPLAGTIIILPFLTFVAVWLWGSAPVPQTAWIAHWTEQAPFLNGQTTDGSALFVHFRTIKENIYYTILEIKNPKIIFAMLVIISIAYLAYFVCRHFLIGIPAWVKTLVVAAGFSPCVMLIIGLDYMRWTSVVAFNVIIALLCLIYTEPMYEAAPDRQTVPRPRQYTDPGMLPVLVAAACYIFLLFPQSTGVAGVRPLPDGFRCVFGVPAIKETWPRNPEACSWSRARDTNR